jgi:hypothetical protein
MPVQSEKTATPHVDTQLENTRPIIRIRVVEKPADSGLYSMYFSVNGGAEVEIMLPDYR